MGIASNHADVMHWFPRFGKSMDTLRADVKAKLEGEIKPIPEPKPEIETGAGEIKTGDLVYITGEKYYTGEVIPQWVRRRAWFVTQVSGDRAVINEDESRMYRISSPVRVSDLRLVPSKPMEPNRVHTVVPGDTLWEISKKYLGDGSRFQEIKELNNLSSNIIYAGWKLKIPD